MMFLTYDLVQLKVKVLYLWVTSLVKKDTILKEKEALNAMYLDSGNLICLSADVNYYPFLILIFKQNY